MRDLETTRKIVTLGVKCFLPLLMIFIMAADYLSAVPADDIRLQPPEKIRFPALKFHLPRGERLVMENGIIIYFLEDHELPLIHIRALVKTGTIYDPEGQEGVAELTANVMRTGGTRDIKSDEIDERLDFVAAMAAVSMTRDSGHIDFTMLNKDLDEGLGILSQMILHPAFEQKKFDLAVELKKEDLRRMKDKPVRFAFREFNRLIYQDSAWGRFASLKSLAGIERSDLIEFHRRFFQPDNMIFAVSGDITKTRLLDKFRQYFGIWKKDGVLVKMPKPPQKIKPGVYCLPKDIPQSVIISGQFAPCKTSPDYFATTVLDFITGSGGFSSRIMGAVRNREGLAYSAGSYYRARRDFGILGAYALTKTVSTMKTLELIKSVLDDIRRGSMSEKELTWAKESINNGFIFSFTTPDKILWQQIHLEYENLPADFLVHYRSRIASVELADLSRIAAGYLDPEKSVILILGDSKNFDRPARAGEKPVLITLPE
ncbi:MAG: insulinase family protein [Deltaproteobacteria bacterium]|nr:insulinase family protein [Deltaproteobacteria bacterium]